MLSRLPKEQKFKTPVLFLHGAWHGAWCWKGFMDYFCERGFACRALDLPGHGERADEPGVWKKSMMDYVDELAAAAQELGNPVVIAHSMGGFVAMKYLECARPPAVVLMAPMPFRNFPRLTFLKMAVQYPAMLAKFPTLRPITVNSERMYRRLFLFNAPGSVSREGFEKASGESSLALMGGGIPTVWLRPKLTGCPALLLASGHDYFFPERAQRRTARVYRADFKIYPDMGHNLMVEEGWEEVAGDIFEWLKARVR
ncbi:MAG: alpha/beta hydrolase [Deltaproteobacteria bacterium]|nr:alpha/beta hydrolase [Candidatus Zymogenaceae bacterium]